MAEEEGTGGMTLWVLCEHGEKGPHRTPGDPPIDPGIRCPGGRQATPEDLIEALGGEKVWWCITHRDTATYCELDDSQGMYPPSTDHQIVEAFILTPALDQEKE